jgi:hypothetical protein
VLLPEEAFCPQAESNAGSDNNAHVLNSVFLFIKIAPYVLVFSKKGAKLDYERMEIKQDKKAKKETVLSDKSKNEYQVTDKAPVLQHAVVEDIKPVEDVI